VCEGKENGMCHIGFIEYRGLKMEKRVDKKKEMVVLLKCSSTKEEF
jgi:hypothetical protein